LLPAVTAMRSIMADAGWPIFTITALLAHILRVFWINTGITRSAR
jgi:hypothetical protein